MGSYRLLYRLTPHLLDRPYRKGPGELSPGLFTVRSVGTGSASVLLTTRRQQELQCNNPIAMISCAHFGPYCLFGFHTPQLDCLGGSLNMLVHTLVAPQDQSLKLSHSSALVMDAPGHDYLRIRRVD
jgi:hypothetical protein